MSIFDEDFNFGVKLARYIIHRFAELDYSLTNLKLNKLIYIIYLAYYQKFERPLFSEEFVVWPYGPILQSVYFEYCAWRNNPIDFRVETKYDSKPNLEREVASVVETVISFYGNMAHSELINVTNHDLSDWWKIAKQNEIKAALPHIPSNDTLKFLFKSDLPKAHIVKRGV